MKPGHPGLARVHPGTSRCWPHSCCPWGLSPEDIRDNYAPRVSLWPDTTILPPPGGMTITSTHTWSGTWARELTLLPRLQAPRRWRSLSAPVPGGRSLSAGLGVSGRRARTSPPERRASKSRGLCWTATETPYVLTEWTTTPRPGRPQRQLRLTWGECWQRHVGEQMGPNGATGLPETMEPLRAVPQESPL